MSNDSTLVKVLIDFINFGSDKRIKRYKFVKKVAALSYVKDSGAVAGLNLGLSQNAGRVIEHIQGNSTTSKAKIDTERSRQSL